jgi:exodeoxyribonuclease VII large subunit
VREELRGQIAELALRKRRAVLRPVQLGRERLAARAERLPRPEVLLAPYAQRLDEANDRLRRGLGQSTQRARLALQRHAGRLSLPLLAARLTQARGQLDGLVRVLRSLNPDAVLERGYARVTAADGRTLTSRAAAAGEAALALHFKDGALAVVPSGSAQPSPLRPRPAPKPDGGAQGKLL